MKNFLMVLTVALLTASVIAFSLVAEAAAPAQDTWVLRWDGYDYYVKAGSLDYTPSHVDAAPEFSCRVAHNGMVRHYRFRARGITVLYVDGEMYSDSQKSRFVAAMYESICNKLIHHR